MQVVPRHRIVAKSLRNIGFLGPLGDSWNWITAAVFPHPEARDRALTDTGYTWAITADAAGWCWRIAAHEDQRVLVQGRATSRAVAAAMVVRAIARGMTAPADVGHSLAA